MNVHQDGGKEDAEGGEGAPTSFVAPDEQAYQDIIRLTSEAPIPASAPTVRVTGSEAPEEYRGIQRWMNETTARADASKCEELRPILSNTPDEGQSPAVSAESSAKGSSDSPASDNSITMEEALLIVSEQSRIVIIATSPFSVIHANAAFARLIEASQSVVGKPLAAMVASRICDANSQGNDDTSVTIAPTSPGTAKAVYLWRPETNTKIFCHMKIIAISSKHKAWWDAGRQKVESYIGHYLIEFTEASNEEL